MLTNFTLREIRPQYDTRRPHPDYPDHPSPFCVSSRLYPCSSETHEADRILKEKERSMKVQKVEQIKPKRSYLIFKHETKLENLLENLFLKWIVFELGRQANIFYR